MRVFLVQHAEANSDEIDPGRHLTEKGIEDAKKLAGFLKSFKILPSAIWHSGKTRSEETAQLIASVYPEKVDLIEKRGMAPNDHPKSISEHLEHELLIVGHLPFLSKLASGLLTGHEKANILSFQHGCCVALGKEGRHWSVLWMVDPGFL